MIFVYYGYNMQYLLENKPYGKVIEEYMGYYNRNYSVLAADDIINHNSPLIHPLTALLYYSTIDHASILSHPGFTENPHVYMILWKQCNINAAWSNKQYANRFTVNKYGFRNCKAYTVRCALSPNDNKYHITTANGFVILYDIFNGVISEWGEYSPHNVRSMMSIKTLRWKYDCDVKFDF